tara:strand:- start:230 stop:859 length:630 start_codon:yes stop_codon:yes gene_type:complete
MNDLLYEKNIPNSLIEIEISYLLQNILSLSNDIQPEFNDSLNWDIHLEEYMSNKKTSQIQIEHKQTKVKERVNFAVLGIYNISKKKYKWSDPYINKSLYDLIVNKYKIFEKFGISKKIIDLIFHTTLKIKYKHNMFIPIFIRMFVPHFRLVKFISTNYIIYGLIEKNFTDGTKFEHFEKILDNCYLISRLTFETYKTVFNKENISYYSN